MRTATLKRTALIALAIVGIAGGLTWLIVLLFFPYTPPETVVAKDYPLVPISSSPYLNVTSKATYAGTKVCSECHERETTTYHQTTHSKAFNDVHADNAPKGTTFTHAPSGMEYQASVEGGQLHHREILRDKAGKVLAEDDRVIQYLVGSGKHARTYLFKEGNFFLESPLTWYTSKQSWGMSPGYDVPVSQGFARMVGTPCLHCHTGLLKPEKPAFRDVHILEQSISCERCHGPGSLHVARHRENPDWKGDQDRTIVHPDSLNRNLLESICGQCHLQAEASIHLRGRNHFDFRPGLALTDFRVDYQFKHNEDQMTVVGHTEQMRLSKCYQRNEHLTCTTCHPMHRTVPADKVSWYRRKCLNCHKAEHCKVSEEKRLAQSREDNCVQCHMPVSGTEIAHVAFTHHRIGIHSETPHKPATSGSTLIPLQDVSHLPAIDRDRALGIAYVHVWNNKKLTKEHKQVIRQKANELLLSVYKRGMHDGETLGALAQTVYGHSTANAVDLAQRALKDKHLSIDGQGFARTVIADAHFEAKNYSGAIPWLEALVKDRYKYEDWFLLGLCYQLSQQPEKAREALEKARKINPFRPEVHQYLGNVYVVLGEQRLAEASLNRAQALEAHPSPRTKLEK